MVIPFNIDGDHSTWTSHLLFSDFILRMAFKTRVDDFFDIRMSVEELSNDIGVLNGSFNSDLESLQASKSVETVVRTRRRSECYKKGSENEALG